MQNASRALAQWAFLTAPMLHLEQYFGIRRLKRGILTMLTGWLGYFAIISMSSRTLNKVAVPLLDMPLGNFLVAQGTAVIFIVALILLVRTAGTLGTAR
jgi:uncharacterized membrane protein